MTAADRITFVGHATALLELGRHRVLTDPALRTRMAPLMRRLAPPPDPRVREDIDIVLISHLHHDHLDIQSLRSLRPHPVIVVPAGAARTLRRRGFADVIELRPAETTRIGELEITATRAAHNGRRFKLGPRVDAAGYIIASARSRVYFAGDTDLFPGMATLGPFDAALLPIGGWGGGIGRGHLDPRRAAEAAAMLKPRLVVPIHWGTLLRRDLIRRADELLPAPGRDFPGQLARRAPGVRACVLSPGESVSLGSD